MTQGLCTAFGGTWDATAGKCALGICSVGEYLQGFDAGGKVCKPLPSSPVSGGKCPDGEVLQGFEADGSKVCVAAGNNLDPMNWVAIDVHIDSCVQATAGSVHTPNPHYSFVMVKLIADACSRIGGLHMGFATTGEKLSRIKCRKRYFAVASTIPVRNCTNSFENQLSSVLECKCA